MNVSILWLGLLSYAYNGSLFNPMPHVRTLKMLVVDGGNPWTSLFRPLLDVTVHRFSSVATIAYRFSVGPG